MIKAIYTFNENDATKCYDYSTNGLHVSTITGFSVVASDIGIAGVFNGTTTDLNFGNILDLGGTGSVSIFAKVKVTAGVAHVICDKSAHFNLSITALNKITFTVDSGAAPLTLTSTTSIVNDTWTTIGAVYDGANMYIYMDGTQDVTTAKTGNMNASVNIFHIGTDTTTYMNGHIEMISIYSQGLSSDNIQAIHDRPGGFKIGMNDSTSFSNGDLIEVGIVGTSASGQGVITGDLGSNEMLYLPLANDIPRAGDTIHFAGNIYDTSRQWLFRQNIVSNNPYIQMSDSVSTFTTTPEASACLDLGGVKLRGLLPPTMTTTQMNAISSPATGLMVYDTDTEQWMGYNGTSWVIIG